MVGLNRRPWPAENAAGGNPSNYISSTPQKPHVRNQHRASEDAKTATHDELVDAKIATAEARTETKMVRLESKLDLVLSNLRDVRDGQRSLMANYGS